MSRSNAHSVWLHGRLRKWVIGATVLALAAWLFEFSTHLHLTGSDDVSSPSAAHYCGYCAAMQMGVGSGSIVVHTAPSSKGHVDLQPDESFSSSGAPAAYRSRAPPVA